MSKRVSILTEAEIKEEPRESSAAAPSTRSTVSRTSSKRDTSKNTKKTEPKAKAEPDTNAASSDGSAMVKLSMADLFSDDCERYTKDCCCCHCVEVRKALRQAAYWKTPEGKESLELKMHLKCFIMDVNAMTHVRQMTEARLKGKKTPFPTTDKGFPITITKVFPIDVKCMSLDWYLHDPTNITHYEIYVDNMKRKRVFNPEQTTTVVLDVDMRRMHRIRMRAMPKKCFDSRPDPVDRLVKDVCCGHLERVFDADYFSCECDMKKKLEDLKEQYKKNPCAVMVNFWKDTEFLYIPG